MLLWLMFEERMRGEHWGEGSLLGVGVLLRIAILQVCLLEGFLCGLELVKLRAPPMLEFRRHIDSLWNCLGKLSESLPSLKARLPRRNFPSGFPPWAFLAVLLKAARVSTLSCKPLAQTPMPL